MYFATIAKAIAAVLTVLLGSGILTGHWFTDVEFALAAINGGIVWLVPNAVRTVAVRNTPPVSNAG